MNLVLGDVSRVGCGGGLTLIVYSQKLALQYRRGGFVHRDRMRLVDVCERE